VPIYLNRRDNNSLKLNFDKTKQYKKKKKYLGNNECILYLFVIVYTIC